MAGEEKTKEQLIKELEEARKRIAELEKRDAEREQLEKKIEDERTLFYALFNQASDSIFLMDPSPPGGPIIVEANKSACAIHGYTREELIGKPISFLDDPETTKQIPQRTRRLMTGEVLTFEAGHVRKDGSKFLVEVSAQVIVITGKPYIVAIDRNISERRQMEGELRERVEELGKFYDTTLAREFKMKDLQEEIEKLKSELSRYKK